MKALQRWQFASQAEQSLAEEIATCQQYGFDTIIAKCLDGTMWMRVVDNNPDAIGGVDDVARQAQQCHDAGISFMVWHNPLTTDDIDTQAQLYGDAVEACDGGFTDAEPYAGFWGANRPQGLATRLMQGISARTDKPLYFQGDPRPQAIAALGAAEWIPYFNYLACQHYWSDFWLTPDLAHAQIELQRALDLAAQWGMPSLPTLPGNADPASFPADMLALFQGFASWRIGTTAPPVLTLLGGINVVTQPTDPAQPTDEQNKINGLITALAQVCDVNGDVLQQAADTLRQVADQPETSRDQLRTLATQIDSVIQTDDGIRVQFIGERPTQTVSIASTVQQFADRWAANPRVDGPTILEGANPHA